MLYTLAGLMLAIVMFCMMLLMVKLGHQLGSKKPVSSALGVTEGAVFTLMALLIAFTFSNASQRFDQRKMMIVEEANAIGTAHLRLDMLMEADRSLIRKDFIDYVDARLAIYTAIPDFQAVDLAINHCKAIQAKLWQDAITACKNSSSPLLPMFILTPINSMFDLANARTAYAYLHPTPLVFVLLILTAFMSAFLASYALQGKDSWRSFHVIAFALISSLTVYIIIDLEFPRLGFIKESGFDSYLTDVRNEILNEVRSHEKITQ